MKIAKFILASAAALSLASVFSTAHAAQDCTKGNEANSTTLQCIFNINSVPWNRTIELNVEAKSWKGGNVSVSLVRDKATIYQGTNDLIYTYEEQFPFRLQKIYSYKKNKCCGQNNYIATVSLNNQYSWASHSLTVKSNR